MAVDFERVHQSLLQRVETLLHEWFPAGKRLGNEYKIGDLAGEPGESLSINMVTGRWSDFATGDAGVDLCSVFAAKHGLTQAQAARALCPEFCNGSGEETPRAVPPPAPQCEPIPDTDPPVHSRHGKPTAIYRYGDRFAVVRYETADGKTFCPWTHRAGRWRPLAYPAPRPLYNLAALAQRPTAPVLIVEGEKCADAATAALAAYACVTWAGGANAVKTADWTSLKGREVIIWPDADAPGKAAAAKLAERLLPIATSVRLINPSDQSDGWDIADAIAEGWTAKQLIDWARKHLSSPDSTAVSISAPSESAIVSWQSLGLQCNSGGIPYAMEANVVAALSQHPKTAGKIWFDTFRQEVYHTLHGAERAWSDHDSRDVLLWLQQELRLAKFLKRHVDEGVLMYANLYARNSVHAWVESAPWDGEPRIDIWLSDFLGCPNDPHHRAAGRNWLISMIARAYDPGCQVDHMLILEGEQRKGKSSVLRALGQPWYIGLSQRFGSKEFLEAIQGNWLIELADLTALAGAHHAHILANITNRSDRYRAPWDRLASSHERRCVFAGSTEKHNDYLADTYGIGRFWSIRCNGEINVQGISDVRQQLFAEALVQWRAGQPYWLMPEQTREEQIGRVEVDPYIDRVQDYLAGKAEATALEIFEAIFVQRDDFGRMIGRTIMEDKDSKRIARIMRLLGWFVVQAKRDKTQGESVAAMAVPVVLHSNN